MTISGVPGRCIQTPQEARRQPQGPPKPRGGHDASEDAKKCNQIVQRALRASERSERCAHSDSLSLPSLLSRSSLL